MKAIIDCEGNLHIQKIPELGFIPQKCCYQDNMICGLDCPKLYICMPCAKNYDMILVELACGNGNSYYFKEEDFTIEKEEEETIK